MVWVAVQKRGIENLAYFVEHDKPIIAAAIVLAIGLLVVLLLGLGISATLRCCKERSRKVRMHFRAKRKDRADAKAHKVALSSRPTQPEPVYNTELDTLTTIYEPHGYEPSGAGPNGRQPARNKYGPTSRYGPSTARRQHGRPQSAFAAPGQSNLLSWKQQPTIPGMPSAQPYRTSPGPRSSISRYCPQPGPEAYVRPASMAPDPLARQQELFRKYTGSIAARDLERRSSSRLGSSDLSIGS